MKIIVAYTSDQRFYEGRDGKWYSATAVPLNEIVKSFPTNVKTWRFFGRICALPAGKHGYSEISIPDDISVEFYGPRVFVQGITGYFRNLRSYSQELERCLSGAHIIWAKQSFVATLIALSRKRKSAYVVTQMIGDPGDTIALRGGSFWPLIARCSRFLNRLILRHANVCIFVSQSLKDKYALENKRNVVVHEGRVRQSQLLESPRSKVFNVERSILYVGRLSQEKGVDVLIEAFACTSLAKTTRLRIVGDGPERTRLQQLSIECGIYNRVDFIGKVEWGAPLFEEMATALVMVLPSYTEGLPLVILECQSQGTPVIATNVGGVPECLLNGEAGVLVPPGNVHALAQAIDLVVSNEDYSLKLATVGLKNATINTMEAQRKIMSEIFIDGFHSFRNAK